MLLNYRMTSVSKKEQNINKLLDDLYIVNNGATIISWLDSLKVYNSTDGKIPGLFLKSKTKIKIEGETYNLILQWIKNNKDKFSNYDFTGIPNNEILLSSSKKNFETIEDIELWSSNPTIHPLTGVHMMPNGYKYQEIYKKAYNIMINNKIDNPNNNNLEYHEGKKLKYKNNYYKSFPLKGTCYNMGVEDWTDWFTIPYYYVNNNYQQVIRVSIYLNPGHT